MPDSNESIPATVPEQPESKPPFRKSMPVVIALVVIVGLIGIANLSSLLTGNKKNAPASALTMSPTTPSAQQISSFQTQQQTQARHDAEELQRQQALATAMQQLQQEQSVPGPESATAAPMTPAQRDAIYGGSSNATQRTSNVSEAQAEAKQKRLALEKRQQDALNSDTVAIDFSPAGSAAPTGILSAKTEGDDRASAEEFPNKALPKAASARPTRADPMSSYDFDRYQGQLYRIFEGTVLEGVVTNHVDGGLSGPILVMLTTDYYSHDHQQLLMPQGTRLIGTVQSVGNAQQRKMFVTFHRAVCSDGFSLDFDKYLGLDQVI
ncbi:TrbI/VirB10 family protein [Terriglobus sp. RCC_193]